MRALTQSELVQALLEAGQPHAEVEVHMDVDDNTKGECYNCGSLTNEFTNHSATVKVVGVRSALNKVVIEVEE